ncbi:MAG TPA: enoyl-CoA hydratase [Acidimicrobiales bacterium]|nr:enoyl-CoA hydratase [Acidimicrobiales bacterium]
MIRSERRDGVVLVTLDRPDRRNAVDAEACRDLVSALDEAGESGARAVVLTGAGGHFCAGADLATVRDGDFRLALRAVLDRIIEAPMPVIVAVDGAALGAGTQLAVAADLRVATPLARFGVPAARLGLMVDHWTVRRAVALAGGATARAMLLAAAELSGEQAARIGFVQRLGDLDAALAWADEISQLAPLTIAGHKLALNRVEQSAPEDPDVTAAFERAWSSADLTEGMTAQRERRAPRFEGR